MCPVCHGAGVIRRCVNPWQWHNVICQNCYRYSGVERIKIVFTDQVSTRGAGRAERRGGDGR